MKSMKSTEKRPTAINAVEPEKPMYPYGLCLDLNDESLKTLGIKSMPKVGDTFTITAKVEVNRTSESESADGNNYRSVGLQITDMDIGGAKKEVDPNKMYGG